MKVVAISDTHSAHNSLTLPSGDILIHAGDALGYGNYPEAIEFLEWFSAQPFEHKVLVAGNHDKVWETEPLATSFRNDIFPSYGVDYLENSAITLKVGEEKVRIYGSPITPSYGNWSFMIKRGRLDNVWAKFTDEAKREKIDILVTHGPPYGHGDVCRGKDGQGGIHVGCLSLMSAIVELGSNAPKAHVFGHIHESPGWSRSEEVDTVFINAAIMDGGYRPTNEPRTFEI